MARVKSVNKRNHTIDLVRFLAIASIVYLHVWQLPSVESTQLNTIPVIIARLGVPTFFAISGYLLFNPDKNKTRIRAKKAAYNSSKLFLWAVALYIPIQFILNTSMFTGARDVFDLVVFNLVHFSAGPLWFLVSLVYVNIIFWLALTFFRKENWLVVASIIILALLLFVLPYGTINGINTEVTQYYLGKGWLFALPFFALGYFIHKYYDQYLARYTNKEIIKMTLLILFVYIGEYILLSSYTPVEFGSVNYELYFFMAPLVACILVLAARFSDVRSSNLLSQFGRRFSLYTYIIHTAVISVAVKFLGKIGVEYGSSEKMLLGLYIGVLIGSLVLSLAYEYIRGYLFPNTTEQS